MYFNNTKQFHIPSPATIGLLVAGGCLLFALSLGIRMNYGILLNAYTSYAGLPYDEMSLVIAIGELIYGVTQPLFGIVAIKRSNAFVLKVGLCLLAVGFISSAFIRSVPMLIFTLGVCISAGTGAVCFGIVMGALTAFISPNKASVISGIVNASSGIGSSLMSPIMENTISTLGLTNGMLSLSVPALLLLPLAYWIRSVNKKYVPLTNRSEEKEQVPFLILLKEAISHQSYQYLLIGFFTCGFHMSLIQNHFYSQMVSYGIDKQDAAFAYTTFGIGTIIGALLCGIICTKVAHKNVLGTLYLLRGAIVVSFFFMPKTIPTAVFFAFTSGLTGDATVTPTADIISLKYGVYNMAFLFGVVFASHQVGAFLSTWLAGILLDMTGSYTLIWSIDLALCITAGIASYAIKRKDYELAN